MRLAALLSLSVLLAVPAAAAETGSRPRIVVLGDSLTSGRGIGAANAYPALLQSRIDAEGFAFDVINAGVSGNSSADGLRRLDAALQGDVRILIVALGANDGLRGVSVRQLKSNLSQIISDAQSRKIAVLLCGLDALPLYGWEYSVAFHRAFDELAEQFHVPLVPFMLVNVIGNERLMQHDHAHPNIEGARQLAANIWPHLQTLVQQMVSPS